MWPHATHCTECYIEAVQRLTKDHILSAFQALSRELERTGSPVELAVAGGAAMVVLFNARESTRDVDAAVIAGNAQELRSASQRIAQSFGLPDDWLNDSVKGFMHGISSGEVLFTSPSLIIKALSLHQLLAMKLSAWRDDVDIADANLLLSKMTGNYQQVWTLVEPYLVPGRRTEGALCF